MMSQPGECENYDRFVDACSSRGVNVILDAGVGFPNTEAWYCVAKGFAGTVIGLEPDPARFSGLEKTYPGLLLRKGLGSVAGEKTLYVKPPHYWSLVPDDEATERQVVEVVSADELLFNSNAVVAIWADIEGFELEAMIGCRNLRSDRRVPVVHVELRERVPREEWATATQVLDELGGDYRCVHRERERPGYPFYDALFELA